VKTKVKLVDVQDISANKYPQNNVHKREMVATKPDGTE
jgi:hypothetical protein